MQVINKNGPQVRSNDNRLTPRHREPLRTLVHVYSSWSSVDCDKSWSFDVSPVPAIFRLPLL